MVNEIESMLEDQKSKDILANRIKTILSGNLSYINSNPVDRVRYFPMNFIQCLLMKFILIVEHTTEIPLGCL